MIYPWGSNRRYNAWSEQSRRLYGTRIQKLAVNAGFSCPNRDGTLGTEGCTFCNNEGFIPSYCKPSASVHEQLDTGLAFVKKRYPRAGRFVAYFQAYSNTHAPLDHMREVYEEALQHPAISGLVIGTRPDCVDEEKLDYLAALSREYFIKVEYGVESCYDETLRRVRRGHLFAESQKAIRMSAERGLMTGIHLIFGLPGESRQQMLDQVTAINELPVHTAKFHQLQIVKGTEMAREYAAYPERFALFSLEEYVEFVSDFLERLRPDIALERLSGEVPPRLIAGKPWGRVRADVIITMIEDKLKEKDGFQGRLYA